MPYGYYGWGSSITSDSTLNYSSGSWTISYDGSFGDIQFSVHEEPEYSKEDATELVKFIDEFKTN